MQIDSVERWEREKLRDPFPRTTWLPTQSLMPIDVHLGKSC